jgi:hypothetical protein
MDFITPDDDFLVELEQPRSVFSTGGMALSHPARRARKASILLTLQ